MGEQDRGARDLERISRERDLYLRVLELGHQDELEPFLSQVLRLVVDVTNAACGYLELYGPAGPAGSPRWSIAQGCSDEQVDIIRQIISRGIVAAALESGRTIVTPSARVDPRFSERESVRSGAIDAVLCAPLGAETPLGVIYLQSRPGAVPFDEADRTRVELVGRHIGPLCDRLLVRRQLSQTDDATQPWRERLRVDGLIGRSRALAAALAEAAAAAPLRDVAVLLTGESGTGKTHLARLIHENSPRSGGPFIELNAAALPDSLIESELFGAVAGAHSTATRTMTGKVAAAEGGTLFLDEIGELPPAAQAKLLQLLHSREYYPLGATRSVRADIRIIAATNADLADAMTTGRFREDLYYRLDVLRIRMPSLAERREDICELARHLCDEACRRNRLPAIRLSATAELGAQLAEWPGNVRQLGNAIERAVARAAAEGMTVAEHRHLFGTDAVNTGGEDEQVTWQEAMRRYQRELLAKTLHDCGGNVSEVARRLDLVRSHVYAMMKAYGLGRQTRS